MCYNQNVWIARHGNRLDFVNPEWFNTAKRRYDPPLSEDGIIQAKQLAKRLQFEKINHIFASPFLRTIQTAHQIAETLNLDIKLESGLGEWHNREWMSEHPQIHPRELLELDYPRINWNYSSYLIPNYPETETRMMSRIGTTIKQLITNYSEDILLVGHSVSVLAITQELIKGNPTVNTSLCSLVKLVRYENNWQMELNGDTSHLK
ncbi:histidine phosphatase family protein [Aphanothece sacrum]|uniref:Phosphoglycerate mutase n=1 Tax=Aphanothece sacrum FPU1 TaxID=1920663 RepID=A0A401IFP6_APHSA|nr:histidine phosphatase family protein [Aphanothece sacrum]GBF80000.1 phosphoglycerate mutase [Aphanothece sacrum FPU1]GBF83780.1 phosphoglycerate mutase [Aphanothece sacrum FPU3]